MAEYEPWLLAPTTGASNAGALSARFMGVTTLLLEVGQDQLLIDGFFSRPCFIAAALPFNKPNLSRIEDGMKLAGVTSLDGALTLQAHHDHAMDAADVARLYGGEFVGSTAAANLAAARGFEGRIRTLTGPETFPIAGFEVQAILSPHSSPNLFKGTTPADLPRSASMWRYQDDNNFSYLITHGDHRILVHGSAGLPPDCLAGVRATIVFLSVASVKVRDFPTYWEHAVRRTCAQLVVPVHWDNFFRSLDDGLRALPSVLGHARRGLDLVIDQGARDGVQVGLMPLFSPVEMPLSRPAPYARGVPPPTAPRRRSPAPASPPNRQGAPRC